MREHWPEDRVKEDHSGTIVMEMTKQGTFWRGESGYEEARREHNVEPARSEALSRCRRSASERAVRRLRRALGTAARPP